MSTPDFEQIARRWCYNEETESVSDFEERIVEFTAVLKSIWNARGAADIQAAGADIDTLINGSTEHDGPFISTRAVTYAIRKLDR